MNKAVTKISSAIALTLLISTTAFADEKLFEVGEFEGVDIGTGMTGTVTCGSENSVIIEGRAKDIERITVDIDRGTLDISRSSDKLFNKLFSDHGDSHSISVHITTNGRISSIDASTGSSLDIPECATSSDTVNVDGSTGSVINISGNMAKIELDLSTGSIFNNNGGNLTADVASVDLSTGAIANLCGVDVISGDLSTGAVVSASGNANTSDIDLSTGSNIRKNHCK